MHNPFAAYRITGTWEDHGSYSYGGLDYPLNYGAELRAPAAGRLEFNGWIGSAGRRATLRLDRPVKRVRPRSTQRMLGGYVEHDCDMVSIVFQHAKGYLANAWYAEGALIGFSGASANGDEWGAQVHLHIHGLCSHGQRVDYFKFIGSAPAAVDASPVSDTTTPTPPESEEDDMNKAIIIYRTEGTAEWSLIGATVPGGVRTTTSQNTANRWARIYGTVASDCKLPRDEYVSQQNEAIALHDSWVALQKSLRA